MNWWLILFISLVFISDIFSFIIGWFTSKKYHKGTIKIIGGRMSDKSYFDDEEEELK